MKVSTEIHHGSEAVYMNEMMNQVVDRVRSQKTTSVKVPKPTMRELAGVVVAGEGSLEIVTDYAHDL